ncbi:MAG TPA: protein kinase, partial [Thermoanaerobaculia bacterium]|nr:protein kinase [Thermoanaerobaculia bacterium]
MNVSIEDFEGDGDDDDREESEDPRLAALVEALAKGEPVDWQQAEASAGSEEEKEQIRALAAISEVATFHRIWLAEGGIVGDLDEYEDESPTDEIPTHWGELEIIERVGRGSFGDVYKAREPRLDRIVALKLIRASARTPEREAETLREGRLLAKVRHPNVATVYGAAGADGRVGFWMEFLEGKNLAEILL